MALIRARGISARKSQLAEVEQRPQHGVHQMSRRVGSGDRPGRLVIALADDLPHPQSAARHQQRRQLAVMVAAAVAIEPRRTSHLARDDQQDPVRQAPLVHVVEKRADRMIHLPAHRPDAGHALGAVAVGVHVPATVRHGDEPAAGLAQPPGEQQLMAQQVRHAAHVVVALQVGHLENPARVVALAGAGIFLRQVERSGDAARDHVEGLLLVAVDSAEQIVRVDLPAHAVQVGQERPAIGQPLRRDPQLHVLLQLAAAAGAEGGVGRPQLARRGHGRQGAGLEIALQLQPLAHRLGQHQHIAGHAGARIVAAGQPGVDGAGRGLDRIARRHHGVVLVIGVLRAVRADDAEPVGPLGQLFQRAAEGDARVPGGNLAGDAAELGRCRHLGIEEFDLRRAAVQEQEHHRLAGGDAAAPFGRGAGGQQIGERQSAAAEGPHAQKVAPAESLAISPGHRIGKRQHSRPSDSRGLKSCAHDPAVR